MIRNLQLLYPLHDLMACRFGADADIKRAIKIAKDWKG
jgi:hypothetical protein